MSTEQITNLIDNAEFDTWADIYAQARVAELISVTFSQFLQAPWEYLTTAGQETAVDCISNGFMPLLPKQAQASQKIQAAWASQDAELTPPKRNHLALVVSN